MFFLFRLHLAEQSVQPLEVAFPYTPVFLNPSFKFLKRRGTQRVDPALRVHADVDESGLTEHAEMLGYLRLAKSQSIDHVPDWARTVQQEFHYLQTVWLGQGAKGL